MYNKLKRADKKQENDQQFKLFARNSKKIWSVIREVIGSKRQKNQVPDVFRQNGQFIYEYCKWF